ncbi:YbaN family protein [Eggerthellaceae bacterium zg-1084]|uniref:YbaN family protein n=1 Tax=Berryella wangjianweii TaxID=2734634 RepID=UPI0015549647|nr:YbaN family protein [Berryella wangjianweii]NPD30882.1 YbaN family protein [Berryella wangjianweii]
MNHVKRALMMTLGCLSLACGMVGIVVPVLPTTPFILLACFLFARSSQRLDAWMRTTKVYRTYALPFQEKRGIPLATKVRALTLSYAALGISAFFVRKPLVWAILAVVAAFLLWLFMFRLPTVPPPEQAQRKHNARHRCGGAARPHRDDGDGEPERERTARAGCAEDAGNAGTWETRDAKEAARRPSRANGPEAYGKGARSNPPSVDSPGGGSAAHAD